LYNDDSIRPTFRILVKFT